jgi:hypothetical protein
MCYYHAKFGKQAKYCQEGCLWPETRVPEHYFGSMSFSRLLYITDSASNRLFLVDTGSAFSIMPWKSQRTPSGPSLSMADSRRIPCLGEQPFTVIINGVPRWWDFLHTAVSYPIIGVDFLSHHGPLVDAANLQLLSGPLPVFAVVPATV